MRDKLLKMYSVLSITLARIIRLAYFPCMIVIG